MHAASLGFRVQILGQPRRSRVQAQLNALKRRAAYREQKLATAAAASAAGPAEGVWDSHGGHADSMGSAEEGSAAHSGHADFMGAAEAAAAVAAGLCQRAEARTAPASEEHAVPGEASKERVRSGGSSQARDLGDSGSGEATWLHDEPRRLESRRGGRAAAGEKPRFRGSADQLRLQLAGLHRKAAFREHIGE